LTHNLVRPWYPKTKLNFIWNVVKLFDSYAISANHRQKPQKMCDFLWNDVLHIVKNANTYFFLFTAGTTQSNYTIIDSYLFMTATNDEWACWSFLSCPSSFEKKNYKKYCMSLTAMNRFTGINIPVRLQMLIAQHAWMRFRLPNFDWCLRIFYSRIIPVIIVG
jgi:hypothetical protein